MNAKNRKTLEDIFKKPTMSSIQWKDIEALLISIGAVRIPVKTATHSGFKFTT